MTNPDDRAFIADQDNWPRWPLLPMKLMGSNPRSAFLMAEEATLASAGGPFKLHVIEIRGMHDADFKPREFASLDEMFDQGWKID